MGRRSCRDCPARFSLIAACLLAAENLRKITGFYGKATWHGDGTMSHTVTRKPRRKAPWMRDWLPDRATEAEVAAAEARHQAKLLADAAKADVKTAVAERPKATDPDGAKRARHRTKRAGPPGRT